MNVAGLKLRQLTYSGPNVPEASVAFGDGLNVVWGASDTGKSFILDTIDFMLGGRGPLRDIPERVGYNVVRLKIATFANEEFVLERGIEGGPFRAFELDAAGNPIDPAGVSLAEAHSERRDNNLSSYLLAKIALSGRHIKKNKRGDTQSLSFRNLARLVIVNEDEIHVQRSPLSDGNYTADTANTSVFKLLLTGVDDGYLTKSVAATNPEAQTRGAQLDLLDQLIREYKERARSIAGTPAELEDQLERLDTTLARQKEQLAVTESEYRQASDERRVKMKKIEEATNRLTEINILLERFTLLDEHYKSDIDRLRGIEEAGSLFSVLGASACPLCGAAPEHHRKHDDCDGNVEGVVAAAQAEINKIDLRQRELGATIAGLRHEASSFEKRLPALRSEMHQVSQRLETIITPNLRKMRTAFSDVAEKQGDMRQGLLIYGNIHDLEERKRSLEREDEASGVVPNSLDVDLSTSTVDQFSMTVLRLLKAWNFPQIDRAHFDLRLRDLVINGKQRTSFGKGLRAVAQAAFTLGLLEYCRSNDTPHPGFALLDSPLLSYREPESDSNPQSDDDLRGTDLKPRFYEHLKSSHTNRQVIIIENTDPPEEIQGLENSIRFTGSPHGRFGLFPPKVDAKNPTTG